MRLLSTLVFSAVALSGCAVYKASQNDGVSVKDIQRCQTKLCLLNIGMQRIDKHTEKNGQYVEIYRARIRKDGTNYLRAAGHGALDVATMGLWEVVGTPVEGAISNNRGYVTAKVTYANRTSDTIKNVVIHDPRKRG
jgi:hypothetical protein